MFAVIAVSLGLMAAAAFGAASVLEERSTKQVPERAALSPRLLVDLVRRPLFVASIAVNIAGAGMQVLALHFGSLTLVQPLLVLSLLFAVVIAAMVIRRRRPDMVLLAGVACCAVGVAGFLAVARPHGGADTAAPTAALPLAAGLAAVLAGCLAAARWGPRAVRPLWLALGCGSAFGVNALLLKIVPGTLPAGFADPLRQWPLYLMAIVTPIGFLLNRERLPGRHPDRPGARGDHHCGPAGVHGGRRHLPARADRRDAAGAGRRSPVPGRHDRRDHRPGPPGAPGRGGAPQLRPAVRAGRGVGSLTGDGEPRAPQPLGRSDAGS